MARHLIFDIDGTLIDSVDAHAKAWQEAFRHFGKEVSLVEVRAQIGKGGDQLLPVFWSKAELARLQEPMSEWRSQHFKATYLPGIRPFPRVRELFKHLLARGHHIALASSAKGDELEAYKQIAQITDLIHTETSSDDADKSKPHPDIFEAALKTLGHPPADDCLVIGDTPYDIQAATKAGLRTVAVRCGGFPEETLQHAVAIYDDPADILAQYEGSSLALRTGTYPAPL